MLRHLWETYGCGIEEREPGIYYLKESYFPTQIIINHELDPKKNLWLYSLRADLTKEEINILLDDYKKHSEESEYETAMEMITRMNWDKMKGAEGKMCNALRELCLEMFGEEMKQKMGEEVAKEIEQRNISLIKKKLAKGKSELIIAEELEEDVKKIHDMIVRFQLCLE